MSGYGEEEQIIIHVLANQYGIDMRNASLSARKYRVSKSNMSLTKEDKIRQAVSNTEFWLGHGKFEECVALLVAVL